MHLTALTLLALAALTSATPIDQTQNATLSARSNPAIVQFFYDPACTHMGKTISLAPSSKHQSAIVGGPWGTRSAWFSSTGDLFSWTVQSGPRNAPRERTVRPGVGSCVGYESGVYVTGDVRVGVPT